MHKKVFPRIRRILIFVSVANLFTMIMLIITAENLKVNIQFNVFPMTAMLGTLFDMALAYLFRTINHYALVFAIINTLISGCLGISAAILSRSHKQAPGVKKLIFFVVDR